jgi:hypothetical protein
MKHGTCPACRHPFFPDLNPVDSDEEESDGGEYIPTEYDADTDYDTDFEDGDGMFGSDGVEFDAAGAETAVLHHEDAADNVRFGSFWTYEGVDEDMDEEEQDWGLTDGDSMNVSEGEISTGESSYSGSSV